MKKSAIIFSIGLFLFTFTACLTGDRHNIYRLEGGESLTFEKGADISCLGIRHKANDGWWLDIVDGEDANRLKRLYGTARGIDTDRQKTKRFHFHLWDKDVGTDIWSLGQGTLYTGPYTLRMDFDTGDNTKKVTINKMLLRTRNQTIDLRKKAKIERGWNELSDLPDSGVLGTSSPGRYDIMLVYYTDTDVIFEKNRNFTIEYDITITRDNNYNAYGNRLSDIENYTFTAKFTRTRLVDSYCLVTNCCALMMLGGGRWP